MIKLVLASVALLCLSCSDPEVLCKPKGYCEKTCGACQTKPENPDVSRGHIILQRTATGDLLACWKTTDPVAQSADGRYIKITMKTGNVLYLPSTATVLEVRSGWGEAFANLGVDESACNEFGTRSE